MAKNILEEILDEEDYAEDFIEPLTEEELKKLKL